MTLEELVNNYVYKAENKTDFWRIIKPGNGTYYGDCEDFVLSVLFYVICKKSYLKFWCKLVFGSAKVCFVFTSKNEGHAVLKYNGYYIDNWSKRWVSKTTLEDLGHKFNSNQFYWFITCYRVLKGMLHDYFKR